MLLKGFTLSASISTMGVSEFSFPIVALTTVLSTFDLSCALVTLETSNQPPLAAIPSIDLPQWTVRDNNNKICMKMAMNATIQSDPEIPIPSRATATQQTGSCDSKVALFTLSWIADNAYTYTVTTAFKVNGNSYKMVEVNGTLKKEFGVWSSWSNEDSSFPSASIGNSMTCQEFNSGTVYFTEYQFQPFAQQSNEQYGKAEPCNFGASPWVYLVIVAVVIVVVAVTVLVIVKVVKSKQGYRELQ